MYMYTSELKRAAIACRTMPRYGDVVSSKYIAHTFFFKLLRPWLMRNSVYSKHKIFCDVKESYHQNIQFVT